MKLSRGWFITTFFLFSIPLIVLGANPLDVAINEIAWMGTEASYNDEWIELYNNTDFLINLGGWVLKAGDGSPEINLTGIISAKSFYLLERTDDYSVPGISADQIYTGALGNSGENLELYDSSGNLIDSVNCGSDWFAGDNSTKQTMERKNPQSSGNDSINWATSQNTGGTPKAQNNVVDESSLKELVIESQPEPQPEPLTAEKTTEVQPLETKVVYSSGIVINEILPSPTGPDEIEEWIEIFNQNNFEVDFSDWQIIDSVGKVTAYNFPKGTKISPQGFLVLSRSTTKITLNNDGDGVLLIQPDGKIVKTINYPKAPQGQSYNRIGEEWFWSTTLTPGSKNILTQPEIKKEVEKKLETETQKLEVSPEIKGELASIGEPLRQVQGRQIPKSLFVFLIAFGLAIFSGVIIFLLKKTTTHPPHPPE